MAPDGFKVLGSLHCSSHVVPLGISYGFAARGNGTPTKTNHIGPRVR